MTILREIRDPTSVVQWARDSFTSPEEGSVDITFASLPEPDFLPPLPERRPKESSTDQQPGLNRGLSWVENIDTDELNHWMFLPKRLPKKVSKCLCSPLGICLTTVLLAIVAFCIAMLLNDDFAQSVWDFFTTAMGEKSCQKDVLSWFDEARKSHESSAGIASLLLVFRGEMKSTPPPGTIYVTLQPPEEIKCLPVGTFESFDTLEAVHVQNFPSLAIATIESDVFVPLVALQELLFENTGVSFGTENDCEAFANYTGVVSAAFINDGEVNCTSPQR